MPADVGAVLMRVLTIDERNHMYSLLAAKESNTSDAGKLAMWAAIGESFVHVVMQQAQRLAVFMPLLCMVLRHANLGSRRHIREALNIQISLSAWRRAKGQQQVNFGERRDNGRTGYRKIAHEEVQRILDDGNSVETSRFCKGRKRARDSDEPLNDRVEEVKK